MHQKMMPDMGLALRGKTGSANLDDALAMDNGGPTRLILPYQRHPDEAHARALSVWSIREIEVR